MTHTMSKQRKLTSRRGVAPVIATLLLVAIAVVGGSIVFVFSQGFFSSAQITGTPNIESLEYVGYDARDVGTLDIHTGEPSGVADGIVDDALSSGERVMIYVQNQGVNKVSLTEVRFAGDVYAYGNPTGVDAVLDAYNLPSAYTPAGFFAVVTGLDGTTAELSESTNAEIEPGQVATIVIGLDQTLKEGRDAQIKLSTANGGVFAGTVVAGQQSG